MEWSKLILGRSLVIFWCMALGLFLPEKVEARLRVVVTTTILADTVQQIGQNKVAVRSLMGSNPHHYKIRTEDIRHLSQAHLVIYNGLSIENGLKRVLSQLPKDVYLVDVSDCLPKKIYDPHINSMIIILILTQKIVVAITTTLIFG